MKLRKKVPMIDTDMEQTDHKYDYLGAMGKIRAFITITRAFLDKKIIVEPIIIDEEYFETEIGFIVPIKIQ